MKYLKIMIAFMGLMCFFYPNIASASDMTDDTDGFDNNGSLTIVNEFNDEENDVVAYSQTDGMMITDFIDEPIQYEPVDDPMVQDFKEGTIEYAFEDYLKKNPEQAKYFLDPASNEFSEAYKKFAESSSTDLLSDENKTFQNEMVLALSNGSVKNELMRARSDVNNGKAELAGIVPEKYTKAAVRNSFVLGANLLMKSKDTFVTGALLNQACQDHPATQYFGEGTAVVSKIKESSDFKKIYDSFNDSGKEKVTDSVALAHPIDLYLSLNKVKYSFRRSNRNCYFEDKYDFETMPYFKKVKGIPHDVVALVNNYAVFAMKCGAINPYKIQILFQY